MLLSVGPVLAAGWARREFRPNGLVVALTAVTMWTVLGGAAAAGLGPDWLGIAVRDPVTSGAFARSLREVPT